MEQQVVRLEIGKLLAVIITVVAVALVANAFLRSDYFKGSSLCVQPDSGATAQEWVDYKRCLSDDSGRL